jgi:iron(III) transport system permease protein
VLRTIVLPLMTPPIVAGIALAFVSCLGNFGIPAVLGIPGNYLVLPTLIYQRLSGLGPGVLSEVSMLSMLIGFIAVIGILLQDLMLRRRDFRITTTSNVARPFELGRWRLAAEIGLWTLSFRNVGAAVDRVGADVARIVRWSAAYAQDCDARQLHFVLFDHDAAKRALVNSFGLSASAAIVIVLIAVPLAYFLVWRRSRLLRIVNLVTEMP